MKRFLILILVMFAFILNNAQIPTNIPKHQNQLFDFTDTILNDFIYDQKIFNVYEIEYGINDNPFIPPGWEHEYNYYSSDVTSVRTMDGYIGFIDSETGIFYKIVPGDWIGKFYIDNGIFKCGGLWQYTDTTQNIGLVGIGDKPWTSEKEGFYDEEYMNIKVWKTSLNRDFFATLVHYDSTYNYPIPFYWDGLYHHLPLPASALSVMDTLVTEYPLLCHSIVLEKGWSGVSSNRLPIEQSIEFIFYPVVEDLIILQTMWGQIYWPDQGINTLKKWWYNNGYKIKMENENILNIYGLPVTINSLVFSAGWNMIPVLSMNNLNTIDVLGTMTGGQTDIVKTINLPDIYWPSQGIYTLDSLLIGDAYPVHFDESYELFYETNTSSYFGSPFNIPEIKVINSPWNYKITSISNVILLKDIDNIFNYGDYIGVFDSENNCCGYSIYEGGKNLAIISYGDDISTNIKDGLSISEKFNFKIFDGITYDIDPIMENDSFNIDDITYGYFNSNNIEVLDKKFIVKNYGNYVEIYNNHNIYYEVYNSIGQMVFSNETNENISIKKTSSILLVIIYDGEKINIIKIK